MPNVVGVDIGCGMYTVRLKEKEVDFVRVDEAAHFIPSGMNVWDEPQEPFDLEALRCHDELKNTGWLKNSLGTLGGGNHFIEIDRAADGTLYLVIHSGSRNLGKQVAEFYQQVAIGLNGGSVNTKARREALIAEYKAAGRQKEIAKALKELGTAVRERTIPDGKAAGPDAEELSAGGHTGRTDLRLLRKLHRRQALLQAALQGSAGSPLRGTQAVGDPGDLRDRDCGYCQRQHSGLAHVPKLQTV